MPTSGRGRSPGERRARFGCARPAVLSVLLAAWPAVSAAQRPPAAAPFEIVDNSFFVEEAFNQEPRVLQNIFNVVRMEDGQWAASITQEWPAPSQRHQLSYTFVFESERGSGGIGDVALHYRLQLRTGEGGTTALAPRASLLLRARRSDGLDAGRVGVELNLPASRQIGDVFLHGNTGVRFYPSVESAVFPSPVELQSPRHVSLVNPFVGGSAIVRLKPMLHLMLESLVILQERIVARAQTVRETTVIVSPGARHGWNIREQQLVVGVAVPFERGTDGTRTGVFGYTSWELPFSR